MTTSLAVAAAPAGEPADSTVVNNTGAAQWTIPIEVPPGPGGFTPSVAIRYSSSRGDGPFGVGWDVELGEVTCSVRFGVPAYFDQGGPPCPRFELDGELLNDAGGGKYHTFVESFQRIVHVTSGGSDHWEVTSPQGITRRYGSTTDSRILAPSGAIVRWLLAEVVNPHGQSIRYAYDGDPLDADHDPAIGGFAYPREVTYGTAEAERTVRFEYEHRTKDEPRTDVVTDFKGGVERRIAYRATQVIVRSDGVLHSRWVLGYDLGDLGQQPSAADYSTGRSRLSYVQRFGSDCTASDPLAGCAGLPAQTFRYRDPSDLGAGGPGSQWAEAPWKPPSFDGERPFYNAPLETAPTRIGDVDGDGLPDVIESQPRGVGGPRVLFNTGSGYEVRENDPYTSDLETLRFDAPVIEFTLAGPETEYAVCDVNIRPPEPTPVTITGYGFGGIVTGTTSVGYEFDQASLSHAPGPPGVNPTHIKLLGNFELVDLDADGRADLVMSVRLSGAHRTHDCATGDLLPEAQFEDASQLTVQVAFRNTGSGWIEDSSLVAGLPIFHMVGVDGAWALWYERGWDGYWDAADCAGFIGPSWPYENWRTIHSVYPCITHANFDPRFSDLDGDGRLDLVIAVPDDPSRIVVADHGPFQPTRPELGYETTFDYDRAVTGTKSLAYLSQDDGSWQRDRSFDPPFHHTHLLHAIEGYPGARTQDAGVRFADLNRDGFTDIVWTSPFHTDCADWPEEWPTWCVQEPVAGYASPSRGVLLNKGHGDGAPHSAWCSSRPLPGTGVEVCPATSEADRFELPAGLHFAWPMEWNHGFWETVDDTEDAGTELTDLNGDGWLDLVVAFDPVTDPPPPPRAWLFSPADGVWVEDGRYEAPYHLNFFPFQTCGLCATQGRLLDVDADGSTDFLRGEDIDEPEVSTSWVTQTRLADLLAEVRTGTGGIIQIDYDTGSRLRDEDLEADAMGHAVDYGEAPAGGDVVRWTTAPVVASVTVDGPARDPATTHYRYAHPRWCREHRSSLGYRIVEKTLPDGSTVTSFFYQHHGRAGRLSEQIVAGAAGQPLRYVAETWDLMDPVAVNGAWAGDAQLGSEPSRLGRLRQRLLRNEYGSNVGDLAGAEFVEDFTYDDAYGFNFVSDVTATRPSGVVTEHRDPWGEPDTDLVIGLAAARKLKKGPANGAAPWLEKEAFAYDPQGKLTTHRRQRNPDPEPTDDTIFEYDGFGNLTKRTDARLRVTEFCYDTPTKPSWCPAPSNPSESASVLIARRDPAVGADPPVLITYEPDPVFGLPIKTLPGYGDVPGDRIALDRFGRVDKRWAITTEGEEWLLSDTDYGDDTVPSYVEVFHYVRPGNQVGSIRTVTVSDGFGGVWKTIRDADVPGSDKYMAVASYRIPAERRTRTTYDVPCTDLFCTNVAGATESAAVDIITDALGRPIDVTTPDGTSISAYFASLEQVVSEPGLVASDWVDVVLAQDANGNLVRRSFDGDRLVAVEECVNSSLGRSSLEGVPCDSGAIPNRTLYGYHSNGQLEIIYDAIAVAPPQTLSDSSHYLRYHFDGAGQVTQIEDPDAGRSEILYDPVGNVFETAKLAVGGSRVKIRTHFYDELDRLTYIQTPTGEPNHSLSYRTGELQLGGETSNAYTRTLEYDSLGRLSRDHNWKIEAYYAYDLLGRMTAAAHGLLLQGTSYSYQGAYLKKIGCVGLNCPESVKGGVVSDIEYDELGRPKKMHTPGGTREFEYFNDDRRHLLRDSFANNTGSSITLQYPTRDPLGNVTSWKVTSTMPDALVVTDGTYAYDHRNRLSSWRRNGQVRHFGYDALGNLVGHEAAVSGVQNQVFAHPTKPHAITERWDVSGAISLASYTYDDWGNLTSDGTYHYRYDSADRLVCVSLNAGGSCDVLQAFYNAQGERTREVTTGKTRTFIGDDFETTATPEGYDSRREIRAFGQRVAYQRLPPGGAAGQASVPPGSVGDGVAIGLLVLPGLLLVTWLGWIGVRGGVLVGVARRPGYATLSGVLIVSIAYPGHLEAGGGNPQLVPLYRWIMSDPIGSGIVELDSLGDLTRHTRFKPFGALDAEFSPAAPSRRYYAGHPDQQETGLMFMKARWMNPTTGTFLSVDPLIRPSDPQSHNAYSYARNNPISNVDPTGMHTVTFWVVDPSGGLVDSGSWYTPEPHGSGSTTFSTNVSVSGLASLQSVAGVGAVGGPAAAAAGSSPSPRYGSTTSSDPADRALVEGANAIMKDVWESGDSGNDIPERSVGGRVDSEGNIELDPVRNIGDPDRSPGIESNQNFHVHLHGPSADKIANLKNEKFSRGDERGMRANPRTSTIYYGLVTPEGALMRSDVNLGPGGLGSPPLIAPPKPVLPKGTYNWP